MQYKKQTTNGMKGQGLDMNIYLQSTGKKQQKILDFNNSLSRKLLLYLSDYRRGLKDSP